MIVIFSQDIDNSTTSVIRWLHSMKSNYLRINEGTQLEISSVFLGTIEISFNILIRKKEIEFFPERTTIWYRRGNFKINIKEVQTKFIKSYLLAELGIVKNFLFSRISENYLGSFIAERDNNKILNLMLAKTLGIKIPDTLITNNKESLIQFSKNRRIITKPINHYHTIRHNTYIEETKGAILLNRKEIKDVNSNFFTSKFQSYKDKIFEIRCFFLKENFYSMAIFSQRNIKTKIDYRNYDLKEPNRCVPFILPKSLKTKLKILMNRLNYDTGSIDLIYSKKREFIFLEINPSGQYEWLNKSCNYYIDHEIAQILSKAK